MINRIAALAACFIVLTLTACVTPALPPTATVATDQDAYIVIGLAPSNARIGLTDGDIRGDAFYDPLVRFFPMPMYAQTEGYIVAKVKPGVPLGIGAMHLMAGDSAIFGQAFEAACKIAVFTPEAGKVLYLAHITVGRQGAMAVPHYTQNFPAARTFLQYRYPELAAKLEQGSIRSMQHRDNCR